MLLLLWVIQKKVLLLWMNKNNPNIIIRFVGGYKDGPKRMFRIVLFVVCLLLLGLHSLDATRHSSVDTTITTPKKKKRQLLSSDGPRRLQREWKDAVEQGIAFDWDKQRPFVHNKNDTPETPTSQQQHMYIGPLSKNNLYVWHFTVQGVPGTVYEHGLYHGRIVLPSNYPAQPPRSVQLWTPSGRFVPYQNICLATASHYHPESWEPAVWSVRTLVEALRHHMVTNDAHEIGGMLASHEERQRLAHQSRHFQTILCHPNKRTGKRRTTTIDHERMLRKGYFRDTGYSTNVGFSEETGVDAMLCSSETISPSLYKVQQHPQQQAVLSPLSFFTSIFQSPVRILMIAFCILFVFLNRGSM